MAGMAVQADVEEEGSGADALPEGTDRAALTALGADMLAEEAPVSGETVARVGFAPIVRVDEPRREVELCATSEAVDTFGTVFDYEASKDAFLRWLGNVREMHDRRAVGRRVGVRADDAARKIFVRIRISRGAQDTWRRCSMGRCAGRASARATSPGSGSFAAERGVKSAGCRSRRATIWWS